MNLSVVLAILGFPSALAGGLMVLQWASPHAIMIGSSLWLLVSLIVGSVAAFTHPRDDTAAFILGWAVFPLAMVGRVAMRRVIS